MAWSSEPVFWNSEIQRRRQRLCCKNCECCKKEKEFAIHLLGRKGQQIYWSLTVKNTKGETVENDDERTFEMLIEAFKDYCKPMKILTVDRLEFLWKEHSENESFEDYLLNLKSSSKDCVWNNVTGNNMIKLQIIKGIHDRKTRNSPEGTWFDPDTVYWPMQNKVKSSCKKLKNTTN